MNTTYVLKFALLVGAVMSFWLGTATANPSRQQRMNEKFQAMIEQDQVRTPRPGAIMFVGSSIFAQWEGLPSELAGRAVENRAVGGSTTADQAAWVNEVVLRRDPTVVVYYCGSNDLKQGVSAEETFRNFERFAIDLQRTLPDVKIVVAASIRSPDRRRIWNRVEDYNQRLAAWCGSESNATFVDINPAFLTGAGEPATDLFQEDELHLLPGGYEAMGKILLPTVEAIANSGPKELPE